MCVQLGLGFVCVYVASGVCIRPVTVLIDSGFCQKDDKNSPTTQILYLHLYDIYYIIHYYILCCVSITVFPSIYSFICLFVIYPITIHLSIYILCFPLSLSVIYRQFIILNLFGVSSLCSELILFDSAVYIAFYLICLCIKRF